MSRRMLTAGRLSRPSRCTLTVSASTLRAAGYPDQATAHADGACARLWKTDRNPTPSTPLAVLLVGSEATA